MMLGLFATGLATLALGGVVLLWLRLDDHTNALRELNARGDRLSTRLNTVERTQLADIKR